MKALVTVTPSHMDLCNRWLVPSLHSVAPEIEIHVIQDMSPESDGDGTFRSPGFDAHLSNKLGLVAEWAGNEIEPFLVSDADIVYFRSPILPLLEGLGDGDLALAAERIIPTQYNIGQMVIRPGKHVRDFFLQVENELRNNNARAAFQIHEAANQLILHGLLKESSLRHAFLSPEFANTTVYEELPEFDKGSIVSYHATASFPRDGMSSIQVKDEMLATVSREYRAARS